MEEHYLPEGEFWPMGRPKHPSGCMGATLRIDYKHPSSLTRWLNLGLCQEREDLGYRYRLDFLDRKISSAARHNVLTRSVAP